MERVRYLPIRYVISLVSSKVEAGVIAETTINDAYNRIMDLKTNRVFTSDGEDDAQLQFPEEIQITNYPNPFNPATTISVSLVGGEDVNIMVTNTIGQVVQQISSGSLPPGVHTFRFDGSALASGVYFVNVRSRSFNKMHPMLLMK